MRNDQSHWWRFLPILVIGVGLVGAYLLDVPRYLTLDYLSDSRSWLKALVSDNRILSIVGFLFLYTIAIAFVFPAPVILTVAGGFLFGWAIGGTIAVIGATLGGALLFLAARTAFGHVLRRRADGAFARFADGFRRDAFTYLLLLRLTPLVPVAALNIGPAFFAISLRAFTLATFLGIIPGAMVYAFLGSGLDEALDRATQSGTLSVGDLVSFQTIAAFSGLSLLALLGIVLRQGLLKGAANDPAAPPIPGPAGGTAGGPASGDAG